MAYLSARCVLCSELTFHMREQHIIHTDSAQSVLTVSGRLYGQEYDNAVSGGRYYDTRRVVFMCIFESSTAVPGIIFEVLVQL